MNSNECLGRQLCSEFSTPPVEVFEEPVLRGEKLEMLPSTQMGHGKSVLGRVRNLKIETTERRKILVVFVFQGVTDMGTSVSLSLFQEKRLRKVNTIRIFKIH